MGFLDFLTGKSEPQCPACGTKGIRQIGAQVQCPNPSCQYFDASLGRSGAQQQSDSRKPLKVSFVAARPVTIRYRNFRGEDQTFTAEADSLRKKKNHIVATVQPTGKQIVLSRNRVQNLSELEQAFTEKEQRNPLPTAKERQVLAYHKKYGTTSPLYEQVRAKYPNW
jgi:hypothetical protein